MPFSEKRKALCESCLQVVPLRRPKMFNIHQDIAGWLHPDSRFKFGFDLVGSWLPRLSWEDGMRQNIVEQCQQNETDVDVQQLDIQATKEMLIHNTVQLSGSLIASCD